MRLCMISARAALSSTFNDIVQNRGLPSPHPVRHARDTHAQKYLGKFRHANSTCQRYFGS